MLGMLLGGSILSGLFGAHSASQATDAQTESDQKALDLQKYMFDTQTKMYQDQAAKSQPWMDFGNNALKMLTNLQNGGGWKQDPGYQFRVNQGEDALSKMAAARGIRMSSSTLKSADNYNQGMASQEYGNYFNRLMQEAGLGQAAQGQQSSIVSQQGAMGQNYANAGGNILGNMGQAQASGYMNQNDAFQGTMNNMFNAYGMQQAGYTTPKAPSTQGWFS